MKASKLIIASLSLSSLVVLAGTMVDMHSNSSSFMQVESKAVVRRFDDQKVERTLASSERELPAAQYVAFNAQNSAKINANWKVTRVIDQNEEVIFDINQRVEDKNKELVLGFEMIGTSRVKVDNDDQLIFDLSLLHESGNTIVLFRSFGEGYEIIEAKKFVEIKDNTPKQVIVANDAGIEQKSSEEVVVEEGEPVVLTLERALNPSKSKNVLKGDAVSGSMTVEADGKSISSLIVDINGESFNVDYMDLNTGGQFTQEINGETVSGIVTNNGKGGYRVRIATGSFAGAMLNFVTDEELRLIREKEENEAAQREELLGSESEIQAEVVEQREAAPEVQELQEENYEQDQEEILDEDIVSYTQKKGFNFGGSRSVASILK